MLLDVVGKCQVRTARNSKIVKKKKNDFHWRRSLFLAILESWLKDKPE